MHVCVCAEIEFIVKLVYADFINQSLPTDSKKNIFYFSDWMNILIKVDKIIFTKLVDFLHKNRHGSVFNERNLRLHGEKIITFKHF